MSEEHWDVGSAGLSSMLLLGPVRLLHPSEAIPGTPIAQLPCHHPGRMERERPLFPRKMFNALTGTPLLRLLFTVSFRNMKLQLHCWK